MLENEVYGGTGELMEDYEIDCNDWNGWFEWDCEYVRKIIYYYLRSCLCWIEGKSDWMRIVVKLRNIVSERSAHAFILNF